MKTILVIFSCYQRCFLLIGISILVSSCCGIKRIFNKNACPPPAPECVVDIPSHILDLASNNAPLVFLHEDDQHGPSSVEWYLERVELRYGKFKTRNNLTESTKLIAAKGTLSANSVGDQQYQGNKSGDPDKPFCKKIEEDERSDFFMDIPVDDQENTRKGDLKNAPCYCHITKSSENIWHINYLFFYPYNADIVDRDNLIRATAGKSSFKPTSPYELGSHEGDWEYFAIEYNDNVGEIEKAFYSAHSSEGKWYKQGNYPVDETTGQPIVYVANKSHANYTTIGDHDRTINVLGVKIDIPPDRTSGQGFQWSCHNRLKFLHQTQPKWLNFNGRWGRFDDPDFLPFGKPPFGPATKGYW